MIDGIPTQEPDDLELGTGANLGGNVTTSKQDLESDELRYLQAFQENGVVRKLLESEDFRSEGKMWMEPYDGALLGADMDAVSLLFPEIKNRDGEVCNTWYTRAGVSTERGMFFNVTLYNRPLVNVNYGIFIENQRKKLAIAATKPLNIVGTPVEDPLNISNRQEDETEDVSKSEKRFGLGELSFLLEVDKKLVMYSFQFGTAVIKKNGNMRNYLSLRISERDKNDRFQKKCMIYDVPEEIMDKDEFKEIFKRSGKVVVKALKQKREERRKRQEERNRRFDR